MRPASASSGVFRELVNAAIVSPFLFCACAIAAQNYSVLKSAVSCRRALAPANPRELRLRSRIEDAGLCARRLAPDEILGADPQVRTNRHFRCAQSAPGACASFALTAASAPPHRAARLAFESDFPKCHGR